MMELALVGWVYFEACGFAVESIEDITDTMKMGPAPTIAGFWVKKQTIVSVVDWRTRKGIACTSVYLIGGDHAIHVIGNTDEVMKKLRQ